MADKEAALRAAESLVRAFRHWEVLCDDDESSDQAARAAFEEMRDAAAEFEKVNAKRY